jgi:hypothetical protein
MTINKLLLAAIGVVALGGISTPAQSDTQPAMAGHPWPDRLSTCFTSGFAMMTNTCTGSVGNTHLLVIPFQAFPKVGAYVVSAYAGGNGSDGMTNCEAITVAPSNSSVDFSAIVSSSTSTALQFLNLGTVAPSIPGTLHFECRVAEGGGRVTDLIAN